MGRLFRFNVPALQQSLSLTAFVETGTSKGDSLAHAAEAKFERLFSIEISPLLCEAAQRRFAHDPRIRIIGADSLAGLTQVAAELSSEQPALFWLDAHFPGAPIANYDAEPDPMLRWPLEGEIALLRRLRPAGRDTIIIDDIKLYLDGPFGNGPAHPTVRAPTRGIDFITDAFKDSHNYSVMWEDEGYLMLSPRFDR